MKVRIKFSKQGDMKFIGHLDLMRHFQKVIRRSGLDIRYSEGMSPHMVMSFAAPLGVGLTSDGEYMDIELNTPVPTQEGIRRLNECAAQGIRILDFRQIEDGKAGKGMSLVAAADYTVKLRDPSAAGLGWPEQITDYVRSQTEIVVKKATKKGEALTDIRPMIYEIHPDTVPGQLFLRLSAGSVANLKPETVMEAFFAFKQLSVPAHAFLINRLDVYARKDGALITLNDLGNEI